VQLPLPKGLNSDRVIAEIDPDKDVDGLTEASAGRLSLGKPGLRPCTPTGCVMLAKDQLGDLSGKHCVVLGRSILVGKPAALLFLEQNCTVTIAHSRTKPGKMRLVGDVNYLPSKKVAGAITPVPGGVGPMTIACLLRNTVIAACMRRGWETPSILNF